jgi:hypothetical protein
MDTTDKNQLVKIVSVYEDGHTEIEECTLKEWERRSAVLLKKQLKAIKKAEENDAKKEATLHNIK